MLMYEGVMNRYKKALLTILAAFYWAAFVYGGKRPVCLPCQRLANVG